MWEEAMKWESQLAPVGKTLLTGCRCQCKRSGSATENSLKPLPGKSSNPAGGRVYTRVKSEKRLCLREPKIVWTSAFRSELKNCIIQNYMYSGGKKDRGLCCVKWSVTQQNMLRAFFKKWYLWWWTVACFGVLNQNTKHMYSLLTQRYSIASF